MPPNQKPTSHLEWIPDVASNNIAPPPTSVRAVGFQPGMPVVAQFLNFALHNLSSWTEYLDEQVNSTVLATSLNHSMRMLGGGTFAFDATTRVLSWSQAITFAVPSSKDTDNVAPAGSVMLPAGNVAFVQVNLPFSTTGDVTQGSANVINLGFEDGIAAGMTVTGNGIAAGTTVVSVSEGSCILSQSATATAAQITLTFVSSGALQVQVSASASLVPGPTTVVLARALDTVCSVGIGSTEMWLRDQERRSLVGSGYVVTTSALAGEALAAFRPVYLSPGAADSRTQGSLYLTDASAANGARRAQCMGFTHTAAAVGATARVVQSGTLSGFSGLQVGAPCYLDPAAIGGITPGAPTTANAYATPVGVAISSTTLLVDVGTPRALTTRFQDIQVTGVATIQSIENKSGIKTDIDMGSFWNTAINVASEYTMSTTIYNGANANVGVIDRVWGAPFAGQVLGIQVRFFSSVAVTPSIAIRQNRNTVYTRVTPTYTAANTFVMYTRTFPRGSYLFAAQDTLEVSVSNLANGSNVQMQVDLIVELAS